MTIQTGERIPEVILQRIREGVETVDTPTLFGQSKAVLFGVPGAFTPTCSENHLPGFAQHFEEFRRRGIDVYCASVNVPDGLQMLADGNAELARALGLEMDASGYGMGVRSRRYALYAEHGVVKRLWVEAPGEFKV
ncbi:MAG TPA: peroxiredoxin, partial [Pseudoxanthomonas sp.]|nr:peroxiredoxin [Pseudoxanthomonas sp.]